MEAELAVIDGRRERWEFALRAGSLAALSPSLRGRGVAWLAVLSPFVLVAAFIVGSRVALSGRLGVGMDASEGAVLPTVLLGYVVVFAMGVVVARTSRAPAWGAWLASGATLVGAWSVCLALIWESRHWTAVGAGSPLDGEPGAAGPGVALLAFVLPVLWLPAALIGSRVGARGVRAPS